MINGIVIGNISIDCKEPEKLCEFYGNLIGWEKKSMYGCPALIDSSGLVILFMGCDFEFIPPTWPEEPGKQQKQMHFDFQVDNLSSAVDEAIRLGAQKAKSQYGGNQWVTLFDPEGHPFCLCAKEEQ